MKNSATNSFDSLLMDRQTFYKYVSCGRKAADSIAKAAGAERRIGRRVMIYRPAIDEYLASGAGQCVELK